MHIDETNNNPDHFSKEEAKALLGKKVRITARYGTKIEGVVERLSPSLIGLKAPRCPFHIAGRFKKEVEVL
jgi:hypothetical protein